ncbi:diacylglycerol kinase [Polaromonas sp.]|nr:diacylglycerol kinase [Candidatus Saccharibacteria bacterium]
MTSFTRAVVIYNPNSTGDSQAIAKEFCVELRKLRPKAKVTLTETTHAGHGEELGYELTKKGKDLLLVSVSGDGGYHELVNGAMKAVDEGAAAPICAVLPGGNANDHYTFISERTLLEAIAADGLIKLDLLKVDTGKTRYAHSYAGLGLTPLVAVELNKHKLSALKEMWLSLQTFWKFKPFKIMENGKRRTFDSLILANIGVMAKHLTLDTESSPHDGKFEILRWSHNHKLRLIKQLAKSAVGKPDSPKSVEHFEFTTLAPIPMQLDGELIKLKANQKVIVTCAPGKLRTYR